MERQETILVTGTGGFIGYHLSKELLARGHNVVGVDVFNDYYPVCIKEARSSELRQNKAFTERRLDLCDGKAFDQVFKDHKIDKVCHLAAQAGVRYSLEHPMAYEESNLKAFLNVLESVRHNKSPRLVYASSSSVYGGNTKVPFSESDRVDNPVSLYAATKKANELMAHAYSHLFKFQTIGLRFFSVYGTFGRPDMALWIFTEKIMRGEKIKVFNHGKMKRDFTYVGDIVKGICGSLFTEGLAQCEIFNLGNHRSENLMDMISIIEKELGREAIKEMCPLQPGDVPESFADIELAQKKLGFSPTTPIAVGIPEFVKWYKAHPQLAEEVVKSRKNG